MFPKNSSFAQAARHQREAREAAKAVALSSHVDPEYHDDPPFENWHHDLVTIDVLLDQRPPELRRARELLAEVADEIHSQFENVHGSRGK